MQCMYLSAPSLSPSRLVTEFLFMQCMYVFAPSRLATEFLSSLSPSHLATEFLFMQCMCLSAPSLSPSRFYPHFPRPCPRPRSAFTLPPSYVYRADAAVDEVV